VGAQRLYYSTASQEYLEPHQLVLQLATAGNKKNKVKPFFISQTLSYAENNCQIISIANAK